MTPTVKPLKVTCSKCKRGMSIEALRKAAAEAKGYSCACRRRLNPTQVQAVVTRIESVIEKRLGETPDPKSLVRRGHPGPSGEAAKEMLAKLPETRKRALEAVRKWPNRTVKELADLAGDDDNRRIGRRLGELEKTGLVKRCPARVCTKSGRRAATWVAA